jgi:hypothetical protein
MASGNSFIEYDGDGVTTDFSIPFAYLAESDVFVDVSGVSVAFTFPTSTTVRVTAGAPAVGTDNVKVYRLTAKTSRLVDWQQGSNLPEADMDNADDQLFYIVQEAFDAVTQGVVDGLAAIDLVTSSAFWGTIVDDVNLATSLASMGFSATVQAILQDADAAAIRTELDVVEDVTTTRGDIIYRNATVPARLAVGAANTLLKSDGTDPSWTTVAAIMDSLLTTRGDILRVGSSTTERLALGASGAALVSDGTDAVWGYTQYQGCVGLKLSNDTDTAHDVNVTAGRCWSDDYTEHMILPTEITKQIDAAWAVGDDAGGLDGSESVPGTPDASTVYYVWLIKRTDTGVVDVLYSESATSPTMPTNYDKKRLIGFVYTDGSANIYSFEHDGDDYFSITGDVILAVNDSTITDLTAETATLPLPPKSVAHIYAAYENTTTTASVGSLWVYRTSGAENVSGAADYETYHHHRNSSQYDAFGSNGFVKLDASSQLKYGTREGDGSGTIKINVIGCFMTTRSHP